MHVFTHTWGLVLARTCRSWADFAATSRTSLAGILTLPLDADETSLDGASPCFCVYVCVCVCMYVRVCVNI
jgi:hypothetical protein